MVLNQDVIGELRSPVTIRSRCQALFELACDRQLKHFSCNLDRLEPTAEYVLQVIRQEYPDLQVPFHSRWRHFEVGGNFRLQQLEQALAGLSALERAKAKFDLAIASVLLDAGAGSQWRYYEQQSNSLYTRSEGLAVCSFWLFVNGLFSSNPKSSYQVDAQGLINLTEEALATGFQITSENPLIGFSGRLELLHQLGKNLIQHPEFFSAEVPRLGNLVDILVNQAKHQEISAQSVLELILESLGEIWPGRLTLNGVNLGDVWPHSALPDTGISSQIVPFHKLSQWLSYSLLEPLQDLGFEITDLDKLTGLPEYRNGGLCLDLGLLEPLYPEILTQPQAVSSEAIVEWRALTVILLDKIAESIRISLGMSAVELPLVKVLQGGTWTAGRRIAAQLREGGIPPIQIISDGTVF